jgi:hypothetical protein
MDLRSLTKFVGAVLARLPLLLLEGTVVFSLMSRDSTRPLASGPSTPSVSDTAAELLSFPRRGSFACHVGRATLRV